MLEGVLERISVDKFYSSPIVLKKITTNALSQRSQFIFKHLKMYNESRSHSYFAVCELDIAVRALDIALGNHALRAQPTVYSLICRYRSVNIL